MSATHMDSPVSGDTPYSLSIMSHFAEWVPRRSMISSKFMGSFPPVS